MRQLIANIELSFHIFDIETWEETIDSNMISIDTSIADSYEQPVDDSGEVLLDNNGVKIVSKGLSENDSIWGPGVVVHMRIRIGCSGIILPSNQFFNISAGVKILTS